MDATLRRELRLNTGGQWVKSCMAAGPQSDCSWVLITALDSIFIVSSVVAKIFFLSKKKKKKVVAEVKNSSLLVFKKKYTKN